MADRIARLSGRLLFPAAASSEEVAHHRRRECRKFPRSRAGFDCKNRVLA
jgi:hypothetical protein